MRKREIIIYIITKVNNNYNNEYRYIDTLKLEISDRLTTSSMMVERANSLFLYFIRISKQIGSRGAI